MYTSQKDIEAVRYVRWRARHDLLYLCNKILGYDKIRGDVHGPIMQKLQGFTPPPREEMALYDGFDGVKWQYKPYVPFREFVKRPGNKRVLILDPRGWFKCLKTNNLVGLTSGVFVTADKLSIGDTIRGVNETTLEDEPTVITGIEEQGEQDCYRITFRSGRTLEVSYNHPIRTVDGWVDAENISAGVRVPLLMKYQTTGNTYYREAELLGWMIGDGYCPAARITTKLQVQDVLAATDKAGFSYTVATKEDGISNISILQARTWLESLGIRDCRSGDKFVPEVIFTSDDQTVREFLKGLYGADGCCDSHGFSYTSKSRRLIDDVQRLLTRLGIYSTVVKSFNQKYKTWYYQLRVRGKDADKFNSQVEWVKKKSYDFAQGSGADDTVPKAWRKRYGKYLWQRGRKPAWLPLNKSFVKYDITKDKLRPLAEALDDSYLRRISSDEIYWDTVKAVEYIGKHPTLAIETSSKTICVEDLITHNSSINAVAHTLQWIINYPNIAILFVQSNLDKAEEVLGEIKDHFKMNERFRLYFPEHCPVESKIKDWGRMLQFTTEAREAGYIRKEPTVTACSIEKAQAGMHYDVIKFSDIVDPSNCKTPEQIQSIFNSFVGFKYLLVQPNSDYWMDVEGTRYDYSDTYGRIIEAEMKRPKDSRVWRIHVRGCYKKAHPDGKPLEFIPEELSYPDEIVDGKRVSNFPQEFPVEKLELEERMPETTEKSFACQMKNNPSDLSADALMFPPAYFTTVDRQTFKSHIRCPYYTTTVDTADTQEAHSDFSAITTVGWSASGKGYVVDIQHGKYKPMELIETIFHVYKKWRPQTVTIEEDRYVNGLKPMIERLMQLDTTDGHGNKTHPWLPLRYIKRDNRQKKVDRILFTLQPWYKARDIVFLDDIPCLDTVRDQFQRFPNTIHDDILDTLADQFQDRNFFGRNLPREMEGEIFSQEVAKVRRRWETEMSGGYTLAFETADNGTSGGGLYTGPPLPSELLWTGGL